MDSHLPDSSSGVRFNYESPWLVSQQPLIHRNPSNYGESPFDLGDFMNNNANASNLENTSLNIDIMNNYESQGIRPSGEHEAAETVLNYINQALFEDDTEEIRSVLYDPLTLQAAEKPFYDAIGKKYPSSPFNHQMYAGMNAERTFTRATEKDTPQNFKNKAPVGRSHPSNGPVRLSLTSSKTLVNPVGSSSNGRDGTANMISSIFSDSNSILQFQKGVEEAMKFLPTNNLLITDSYKYTLPPKEAAVPQRVGADFEEGVKVHLPISSRGRKHRYCQDGPLEELRSRKQSAVYEKEVELSELFDKILLYDVNVRSASSRDHVGLGYVSSSRTTRSKKKGAKDDTADMRTLLTSCVRAIASSDRTSAYEKLEQIKKHASPTGDGNQRVAYAFANGLEARLAGNGKEIYGDLDSQKLSSIEKLKKTVLETSTCQFTNLAVSFSNEMILKIAEKASILHIVDFGISYGFQWPKLIQQLSTREGGPPKLRITGIELPQPGFRPTSLVEESGQLLAKYCERFNVPFEYQVIVTKSWDEISVEELKVARNEVVAVSCMFRFRYLLDETVVEDSPRDRVLRLIKKMKPDIFVHTIVNGGYHVPLFANRFREAFFYYSALFDFIDANIPREHPIRLYYEEEIYGREVGNVISCEGSDRVERPETYKIWQSRYIRAGFKRLPLNPETVERLKTKTDGYHKDYTFHEDGNWVLQGWKGRILFGTSCWLV